MNDGRGRVAREDGGQLVVQECQVSQVFGYTDGQVVHNSNGRAWTIEHRDGYPWAIRTPEHDSDPSE